MEPDWQALLFGEDGAVIRALETLSAKRFPSDRALADAAFNHALGALTSDDYGKLRRFRGDSKPKTFLITCFRNALEDFARAKFGKCLPPAWLKAFGRLYVTVHRQLCCENQATRTVIDSLRHLESIDEAHLRGVVARVLEHVPGCFQHGTVPPKYVEFDESEQTSAEAHPAPGEKADDELLAAIWAFVVPESEVEADAETLDRLRRLRLRVLPGLALTDDQKVLIRLVTAGGRPLAEAAEVVRMNYHTARRQLQAGLARLKQAFDDGGLTMEHFS
jgi:RNA polymerase sigma factor (sigma-70 family)